MSGVGGMPNARRRKVVGSGRRGQVDIAEAPAGVPANGVERETHGFVDRAALVGRPRNCLEQRNLLLLLVQISQPVFRDLFRL